jgi:hypothetical protein
MSRVSRFSWIENILCAFMLIPAAMGGLFILGAAVCFDPEQVSRG